MMKLLIASFLIFGSSLASILPHEDPSESFTRKNINDYVDSMIPSIIKHIIENGLDPMQLPDIKEGFSVQPVLVTYHGELELTNGWFRNLRSFRRSGDVTSTKEGHIVKVTGNFAVDNISFDYDYLAKIMNIGPKGGLIGSVTTINVFCEIHINTDKKLLRLREFHLSNLGNVSVKFTGNALLDWLTNALSKVVTTLFKDVIFYFVEKTLRTAIEEFIEEYNFTHGSSSRVTLSPSAHQNVLQIDNTI